MGAMNDGVNAVTRYFRNNFGDGYRQVGLMIVFSDIFQEKIGKFMEICSREQPFMSCDIFQSKCVMKQISMKNLKNTK